MNKKRIEFEIYLRFVGEIFIFHFRSFAFSLSTSISLCFIDIMPHFTIINAGISEEKAFCKLSFPHLYVHDM
jgi:hypothetical protein